MPISSPVSRLTSIWSDQLSPNRPNRKWLQLGLFILPILGCIGCIAALAYPELVLGTTQVFVSHDHPVNMAAAPLADPNEKTDDCSIVSSMGKIQDFTLTDLDGKPFRLGDHLGQKPIVLEFGSLT